jgi:uncharacterized protein
MRLKIGQLNSSGSKIMSELTAPTSEAKRIESLDVFRGFALLGILLLNIIGFGMLSPTYSNPGFDLVSGSFANIFTWATIELFAEGAMRCLFSILFGAGVVLFTTGESAKSGWTHYKRTFWLLMFGLLDAYILLWSGDILVAYALAGALLYLARNQSARSLLTLAGLLILLMSLFHMATQFGLGQAYQAYEKVRNAPVNEPISEELQMAADGWLDFAKDFTLTPEAQAAEIEARTSSYASAFAWNAEKTTEIYQFVLPVFLFWDALAMMLIGMALYKTGVLQASRPLAFYKKLVVFGFGIGLLTNGYEVYHAYSMAFDIFATFAQMQPTYHIGRLAMALGYIGLLGWIVQSGALAAITARLAAVGRMALTNYLMHSLICALIFTGMGLGTLGEWQRYELYGVVVGIWLLQLWLSPLWLARFRFGPVEWLWRTLTYGKAPQFSR